MKTLFFAVPFLLLTNMYANAQEKSDSRWREVERRNLKKKTVSFTDTMFLTTKDRKYFGLSKTKNSLVFKADLEDEKLDFGYEIYEVKKNKSDEIILADAQYFHVFERENINKEHQNAPIYQKNMNAPEGELFSFEYKNFQGNWQPYKKYQKNGNNDAVPKEDYIRDIIIVADNIEVYLWNDMLNKASYTLQNTEEGRIILKKANSVETKILIVKYASESELIMEDDSNGMLYFLQKK